MWYPLSHYQRSCYLLRPFVADFNMKFYYYYRTIIKFLNTIVHNQLLFTGFALSTQYSIIAKACLNANSDWGRPLGKLVTTEKHTLGKVQLCMVNGYGSI